MELPKSTRVAIFFLRLGVGALLIVYALFEKQAYAEEGFKFFLFSLADKGALSFYKPFILSYLFPNAHAIFNLLIYSYFVIGTLFVLGLFVRVASWYLFVIALNFLFILFHLGITYQVMSALWLLISFSFLVGNFGKVAGLDALLRRRSKDKVPLESDIMEA